MSIKKGDRVKYGLREGLVIEIKDGGSSAVVKWDKSGDKVGRQSEVAISVLEPAPAISVPEPAPPPEPTPEPTPAKPEKTQAKRLPSGKWKGWLAPQTSEPKKTTTDK